MNPESSRRSACDRCRGQKLRCVRSNLDTNTNGNGASDDEAALRPCERCLKAGAECVNTLPRHRKFIRAQRERERPGPVFASSSTQPYPQPYGARLYQQPPQRPLTGQLEQVDPRTGGERPAKRRSVEESVIHQVGRAVARINALDSASVFNLDSGNGQSSEESSSTPLMDFLNGTSGTMAVATENEFNFDARLSPVVSDQHLGTSSQETTREEAIPPFPALPMPDASRLSTREDSLHRLSQLSSSLVKSLARTSALDLSDILSYTSDSDSSQTISPNPKNTIGVVMTRSQTFLDILRQLQQQLAPDPPLISSAESECSYSEYWDENTFLVGDDNAVISDPTTRTASLGNNNNDAENAALPPPLPSSSPVPVDMPTTLTILTCYTWLLQSYDTLFASIYDALTQGPSVPSLLPGLHLGGFALDDHRDLQLEVLLHLSTEILQRIEEVLGISVIAQRESAATAHGILDAAPASAVLEIMFTQKQTGQNGRGRQTWNPGLLRQTMGRIREVIRTRS